MITDERLKELMISVGMPDSKSLYQALKQCDMEAELRASEELETMRASNRIKQANIELLELNVNRLEALNRSFEANEKRMLETAQALRAENAKLIAERDEWKEDYTGMYKSFETFIDLLCKRLGHNIENNDDGHWFNSQIPLLERIDVLLAGREAMMKQEPVARGYKNSMTGTGSELYWLGEIPEGETNLYASPLPAQIPEGYALVPIEPTDDMDKAYTLKSGQSHLSVMGYKAMLSASQPKGDV